MVRLIFIFWFGWEARWCRIKWVEFFTMDGFIEYRGWLVAFWVEKVSVLGGCVGDVGFFQDTEVLR